MCAIQPVFMQRHQVGSERKATTYRSTEQNAASSSSTPLHGSPTRTSQIGTAVYNTLASTARSPQSSAPTKSTLTIEKSNSDAVRFHREHHLPYCEISTKYNHEIHVPFLSLARILVGDDELGFVPEPAFAPPVIEVQMSSELRARYQRELGDAAAVPLPEE